MGILAEDNRPLCSIANSIQHGRIGVAGAANIGKWRITVWVIGLVIYKSCRIRCPHIFCHFIMDRGQSAFISHAPHDHTGMILIALKVSYRTVHKCRFPTRLPCQEMLAVMTFGIYLIANIKTPLVSKVVKQGVIGVMTGPYTIDIQLLHQLEILFDCFLCHGAAQAGIVLMPVDAFNHYRNPVDQHLSIFDLEFPEANSLFEYFNHCTCGILQFKNKGIKVWFFCRPFQGIFHLTGDDQLCLIACHNGFQAAAEHVHLITLFVKQLDIHSGL